MARITLVAFLISTLIGCLNFVIAQEVRTPLCERNCTCNYVPNNPPDVNCSYQKGQFHSIVYDRLNWFDSSNTSYPINSLSLAHSDLGDLKTQFPSSNLILLDLSGNYIREIADNVFCQLQNMETLILSYNDIEVLKPDAFAGLRLDSEYLPLRSMKTLNLSHNQFHTLDPDLFEHFEHRVEVLDLGNNPFKVIDQQTAVAIGSLVYLKELYMSNIGIKELPQHFMHTPKYLSILDLSGNRFTEVPLALEESHALQVLHLNNNPIVNLTLDNGFPNISTLIELHICDMPLLERIGSMSLGKLEGLKELHIGNNIKLKQLHESALVREDEETWVWPVLEKLYVENNQLTHLERTLLPRWDILKDLNIKSNPWTCECENQWMVEELMPIYLKINLTQAKSIECAAPIEMVDKTLYRIYESKSEMRCLDYYGHRPERDAVVLVGILVGLLIGIPLMLSLIYAYQRHWFGVFDNSPAAFSRQFYSRTRSEE